jgi:hypothetical protein
MFSPPIQNLETLLQVDKASLLIRPLAIVLQVCDSGEAENSIWRHGRIRKIQFNGSSHRRQSTSMAKRITETQRTPSCRNVEEAGTRRLDFDAEEFLVLKFRLEALYFPLLL